MFEKIVKRFIKDNVYINENEKLETDMFFGENLLKIIKYIDAEFYKELQQRVDK